MAAFAIDAMDVLMCTVGVSVLFAGAGVFIERLMLLKHSLLRRREVADVIDEYNETVNDHDLGLCSPQEVKQKAREVKAILCKIDMGLPLLLERERI